MADFLKQGSETARSLTHAIQAALPDKEGKEKQVVWRLKIGDIVTIKNLAEKWKIIAYVDPDSSFDIPGYQLQQVGDPSNVINKPEVSLEKVKKQG